MTLEEAKDIVENSEIINPETEHSFVKGCYSKRYNDAMQVLANKHKDDPCPPDLTRTKILNVDGFQFKVSYNYVPLYNIGISPMNCWWVELQPNDYDLRWDCPLKKTVKTLEEACRIVEPTLKKVVERAMRNIN